MPDHSIQIIRDFDSLQLLEDDWNRLSSFRNNPLFEFSWYYACAKELHGSDNLYTVTHSNQNGKLDAIAPLVLSTRMGISILEFIGSKTLMEPVGFLYTNATALSKLYNALVRFRYPLEFNRLWTWQIQASGFTSSSQNMI